MPALRYGLKACPLRSSDNSLDFVISRFCLKQNLETVAYCRVQFNFDHAQHYLKTVMLLLENINCAKNTDIWTVVSADLRANGDNRSTRYLGINWRNIGLRYPLTWEPMAITGVQDIWESTGEIPAPRQTWLECHISGLALLGVRMIALGLKT